ncbi:MAG: hypothetical protein A2Y65_11985 [Deltaproteobacteria bacterium RBG_13_52_11]|nr:MAG: hypothetical protein A2Y65_11985 [Deltaproteobacteria bacterium RBG_13_52_11]
MQRTVIILTIALVVGVAIGMLGHQVLIAQQSPIKRTILQQKDLEGVRGKEVIMFLAEIAPGGELGRHYHPGPEFFYILEGALTIEPDGKPPVTIKAGESWYGPAKYISNQKNASKTKPLKTITFMVVDKGQPLTTPIR